MDRHGRDRGWTGLLKASILEFRQDNYLWSSFKEQSAGYHLLRVESFELEEQLESNKPFLLTNTHLSLFSFLTFVIYIFFTESMTDVKKDGIGFIIWPGRGFVIM